MGLYADELAVDIQREVDDNNATRADYERAIDIVFPTPDKTQHVEFNWSTEYGFCHECGLPAAFYTPEAYGDVRPPQDNNKLCAVCAANAASEGERVARIDEYTAPLDTYTLRTLLKQVQDQSGDWRGALDLALDML